MFDLQTRYLGRSPISGLAPSHAVLSVMQDCELDRQNELPLKRLFNEKAAEPTLKSGCAKSHASAAR